MSKPVDHFIETYLRDEDRFFFTDAMLEGRDFRVEAALRERMNELADSRRSTFRVIESGNRKKAKATAA